MSAETDALRERVTQLEERLARAEARIAALEARPLAILPPVFVPPIYQPPAIPPSFTITVGDDGSGWTGEQSWTSGRSSS